MDQDRQIALPQANGAKFQQCTLAAVVGMIGTRWLAIQVEYTDRVCAHILYRDADGSPWLVTAYGYEPELPPWAPKDYGEFRDWISEAAKLLVWSSWQLEAHPVEEQVARFSLTHSEYVNFSQ